MNDDKAAFRASGTFDVKLTPQPEPGPAADAGLGRFTIAKQFHGDLEGAGEGQMLAARTAVDDSAGYVAIEHVSGVLKGRAGTFMLQHIGIMNRGQGALSVTVVPDSRTEQLAGIAGRMKIVIEGRNHSYEFEYTLRTSE